MTLAFEEGQLAKRKVRRSEGKLPPRGWETPEFLAWLAEQATRVKAELRGRRGFLQISSSSNAMLFWDEAARQRAAGTPLATKLATYDPASQVIIVFAAQGKGFEYMLSQLNGQWVH